MIGTASPTKPKARSPAGSAPRIGSAGSGPTTVPSGDTCDPTPSAKPGPANHDAIQMTTLGTNASCPAVTMIPPSTSVCSDSYSRIICA